MENMENMDKMWKAYITSKSPELKEKIILKYAHLVKYVAGRLLMHLGQHVEYDDLISYGIFGLIDAIDKFDPDKNVKFETYASLRIKGSIIDNIRKTDWVPRTLRQRNKQFNHASTRRNKFFKSFSHLSLRQPAQHHNKLIQAITATMNTLASGRHTKTVRFFTHI